MEHHFKKHTGTSGTAQKILHSTEMSEAAHRQKFGDSLNDSQYNRMYH